MSLQFYALTLSNGYQLVRPLLFIFLRTGEKKRLFIPMGLCFDLTKCLCPK